MPNFTINAQLNDQRLYGEAAAYADAIETPAAVTVFGAADVESFAGQALSAGTYFIFEAFMRFDTSGVTGDYSSGSFNYFTNTVAGPTGGVELRRRNWAPALTADQFEKRSTLINRTLVAAGAHPGAGAYQSAAFVAGFVLEKIAAFDCILVSKDHVSALAPAGDGQFSFRTADTTSPPYLSITTTEPPPEILSPDKAYHGAAYSLAHRLEANKTGITWSIAANPSALPLEIMNNSRSETVLRFNAAAPADGTYSVTIRATAADGAFSDKVTSIIVGAKLWTPIDLGTSLARNYKADDPAFDALVEGAEFLTWPDVAGKANMAQRAGGAKPIYAAPTGSGINGRAAIQFAGTRSTEASPTGLPTGNAARAVYIVARGDSDANHHLFEYGSDAASSNLYLHTIGSNRTQIFAHNDTRETVAQNAFFTGTSRLAMTAARYAGGLTAADIRLFHGANAEPGQGGIAALNTEATKLSYFNKRGNNFHLAEVTILNRDSTDEEHDKIIGHYAWKWGFVRFLPGTHAYKTEAPLAATTISATVTANERRDTTTAAAISKISATVTANERRDTTTAKGALLAKATGVANEQRDTTTAAAVSPVKATATANEQRDTTTAVAQVGAVTIHATVNANEQRDTTTAKGALLAKAAGVANERRDTTAAAAVSPIRATAAANERRDTTAAAAVSPIYARAAAAERRDTTTAAAAARILASVAATEQRDSLVAVARGPMIFPVGRILPLRGARPADRVRPLRGSESRFVSAG